MKSFVKYRCEVCNQEHTKKEKAIACELVCSKKKKCYHDNTLTHVDSEQGQIKAYCRDCGGWLDDVVMFCDIEDEDWDTLYNRYK